MSQTSNPDLVGRKLVEEHRGELVELCRRFAVRRLRLFGSAASGNFDSALSDLDFLVDFDPPIEMNLFHQFIDLKLALEDLFGRHVDLVTWKAVRDPYFRQRAEETAIELYAA
jgi:hypothetical protein